MKYPPIPITRSVLVARIDRPADLGHPQRHMLPALAGYPFLLWPNEWRFPAPRWRWCYEPREQH